jgi:uncharacterized protein YggE
MTSTGRFRLLLTCTMFAILSGVGSDFAVGQFPGANAFEGGLPGNVSGTGVVKIEKQPTMMRMKIDLFAKGSSIKEALANLEDRKKSAGKQLEDLGADVKSIAIGTASVSTAQSNQQQQQMSMMLDMLNERRGRQAKPNPPKIAVPITVTCSLTAEWNLTAKTPGELLEFAHPLQQKIRDADISGAKDATALSPEQQELVEEMGNEYGSNRYSSSDEAQPGTPAFVFAAAVSEEEQDQALAEAFQKARAKAARLSKATGMSLGKLVSVSSNESRGPEDDDSRYYGGMYYGSGIASIQAMMDENNSINEAVGIEPGVVKATVTVTARFDFR